MRLAIVTSLALVAAIAVSGLTAATDPASALAAGPIGRPGDRQVRPAEPVVVDGIVSPAPAIVAGSVNRTSLALTATYNVTARLGFGDRSLRVDTRLTVRNDSGAGIDRVELNTIAARLGSMRRLSASVDGTVVAPTRSDQTIIVPLGGVLPAGATATVYLGYSATLRSGTAGSDWMFTRANGVVDLYRWIPWVSLARRFDRPNHGDPFVTPVSPKVVVTVTADRALVFATSGVKTADAGLTERYEATNVRDFVLTAAPDFRTASRRVDGVFIQAFVRPGVAAGPRVDIASRMVRAMVARVGPYPHSQLLIVQSAGGYAMEGPGIIWLPGTPSGSQLTYLIAHETAHQWFYGAVGNDQALAPFTDEAAAEFLARNVLGSRRASRCSTAALDRTIYDYSGACYYETVYIQGSNVLDDLRRRMGDTAFWRTMRSYVATWRWKLAPPRAMLDALDAATSLDFGPVYRSRFPRWY
jgi:hypothetical protein